MDSAKREHQSRAAGSQPTPEINAGYERGQLGNPEGYQRDGTAEYTYSGPLKPGVLYVRGHWRAGADFLETAAAGENSLMLSYAGAVVAAVLAPGNDAIGPVEVVVRNDDTPVSIRNATADTQFHPADSSDDESFLVVDRQRAYELVDNPQFGTHILEVVCRVPGLRVYGFRFTGGAQVESEERQSPAA